MINKKQIRNLVISRGAASLGAAFAAFGINLSLYTNSGKYFGYAFSLGLISAVPLLFAPLAGYISDKFDKVRILLLCEILSILTLVLLGIFHLQKTQAAFLIAAFAFLLAVISEFRYTCISSLLPTLANKSELTALSGIQQSFRGAAIITGPLLGALSYHYLGLGPTLLVAATTNLIAYLATVPLRKFQNKSRINEAFVGARKFHIEYYDSLQWMWSSLKMRHALLHFSAINASISIFGVLITPHILQGNSEKAIALTASFQGAGVLMTGFFISKVTKKSDPNFFVVVGSFILGVGMVLFGIFNTLPLLLCAATITGCGIAMAATGNQTLWQTLAPSSKVGKLIAIRSVFLYVASPLAIWASIPLIELKNNNTLGSIVLFSWHGFIQALTGCFVMAATAVYFFNLKRFNHNGE
ncbi:MFS transporter [Sphingomonas sp. NCPPB 2930]